MVLLFALLFVFSNQISVALQFWPFVGSLHAPLFLVVLVVFVCAFFMGIIYGRVIGKK